MWFHQRSFGSCMLEGGVRSTPVLIFTSFLDIEGPWPCNIVDCLCGVDLNHGVCDIFMPKTLPTYINVRVCVCVCVCVCVYMHISNSVSVMMKGNNNLSTIKLFPGMFQQQFITRLVHEAILVVIVTENHLHANENYYIGRKKNEAESTLVLFS